MADVCTECLEGRLVPQGGEGRWFTYRRGSRYELPADFQVPTCSACGARFLDDGSREAARALLKPAYLEDQRRHVAFLVKAIQAQIGVSSHDLERACGITPTCLSQLLEGRKEASEPLIGLLEAFAVQPSEVLRRLERKGAHNTESVKTAMKGREEEGCDGAGSAGTAVD